MAYADMREFLAVLEEDGELRRVADEVDWRYELGAWSRKTTDLRPFGPALQFERIRGYSSDHQVVTSTLASYRRIAMSLGLPPETPVDEIISVFKQRLKSPIAPKIVSGGPVKENIHLGSDADLLEFPVPWWTPLDGGRYVGTWHINVTKDLLTGQQNVGTHRMMVHDGRTSGVDIVPSSHLGGHYAQRVARDEPLEMAAVIGSDELVTVVGGLGFAPNVDEFTVAGGLRESPVELVKCETVDLYVPANAEIVVEGVILPHERRPEGPFGEHTGYHGGGVDMNPVFQVTAITHRDRPILRGSLLGKPVTEYHIVRDVIASARAIDLFENFGPDGIIRVRCPVEGASSLSAIIQMKPRYVGHALTAGQTLLSSHVGKSLKYVVIVDDDIDPADLGQVWWAILTRTQRSRDFEMVRYRASSRCDPSVPMNEVEYTDKMVIDATKKLDYPFDPVWGGRWAPTTMPPPELMELVEYRWKQQFEGDASHAGEISRLKDTIENDLHPRWEGFREKSYRISG